MERRRNFWGEMKRFWGEILSPNLLSVLLLEDGRKYGIGCWIILIATVLALKGILSGEYWFWSALVGSGLATGSNMFTQWLKVKVGKDPESPSPKTESDAQPA